MLKEGEGRPGRLVRGPRREGKEKGESRGWGTVQGLELARRGASFWLDSIQGGMKGRDKGQTKHLPSRLITSDERHTFGRVLLQGR